MWKIKTEWEIGKQTGRHRAVHRVLWSGTTVPHGTLTHGPRLSHGSLTTICFPLIQKHSPSWFLCKNRASSFKKLSGCCVQKKCSSTEESSVCLQNSHRIHSLYKTPLYVRMMITAIQDAACFVDLYVCFSFSPKALMSLFWKLFGIIFKENVSSIF